MVGVMHQQGSSAGSSAEADHGVAASAALAAPPRVQRIKRLDPPNKSSFHEQIAGLQAQIDDLQRRILEIKDIVDNKTQNRHVASPELSGARNRLAELNVAFKAAVEAKRSHREELDLVKEKLRSDVRSGLPEVKVEHMDEEIRNLEYRQTHTTLPIDGEKRLIVQIAKLKKSRESIRLHDSRTEQDQGSRAKLVELIKEDEQLLNSLKAQQEEQRHILADIRDKEAALALDIPALLQEKSSSYEKIRALRDEIRQMKAEFSAKEDEYWRREREWRAQQALERRLKAEKIRAERLEREKIRKQRALENFIEPYTDEIILCDQLMSYMQKNAPLVIEETSLPQPQQKTEIIAPQGFGSAIVSKKNRNEDDLEGWFAGFGGKKGKKTKAPTPSKSKVREKISLSLDALSSFEKVKISPPTTYGDVLKSLDDLKKKKDYYLEMQKKAREKREKGENEDIHTTDHTDGLASEASVEEMLSDGSSLQAMENGSCSEHDVPGENVSCANSMNTDALPDVENGTSLELEVLEKIDDGHSTWETSDSTDVDQALQNGGEAVDGTNMEILEASENDIHTEDLQAPESGTDEVVLQAAENWVHSDVPECGTQNEALEKVPETAEVFQASECGTQDGAPTDVPETIEVMRTAQIGEHTELLEMIEIPQVVEGGTQKGELTEVSENIQSVVSTQAVEEKGALHITDNTTDSTGIEVLQRGEGEERLALPVSDN